MAQHQSTSNDDYRIPDLPFMAKARYGAAAFAIQNLLFKPSLFARDVKALIAPSKYKPDLIKKYECRPNLPIRVFFPKDHDKASKDLLPVLFTIHGGGFLVGDPSDNDEWNHTYASQHRSIVIALNYGKAPSNPFPVAIYDCEALFLAALEDESLPFDRTRAALLGWSAGGNLTLAVSQLESVREHLSCIVPLYPAIDLSIESEDKAPTRQYKPALGGFRGKDRDLLLGMAPTFDWAYKTPGEDSRNPLMSPCFAARESLPNRVFLIACELDILAHEGQRLIHRLAGRSPPPKTVGQSEPAGMGQLILDDENFHFDMSNADGSAYRWLLVPDTIHGFDQSMMNDIARDSEYQEDATIKTQKTMDIVAEWVLKAPPTCAT